MSTQFREPKHASVIYAIDNCPGTRLPPKRKCADCTTLLNHRNTGKRCHRCKDRKADELIALAHTGRDKHSNGFDYNTILRKAR